jgi:hypothetical protein
MISILVALVASGLVCVGSHLHFQGADCDHQHFSTLIQQQQGHLLQSQRPTSSPHQGGSVSVGSLQMILFKQIFIELKEYAHHIDLNLSC